VENLQRGISRETWGSRESRVERNVDVILDLLQQHGSRGTFFVLGWIAERVPGLVRRIHALGHEVASHGYGHELVYRMRRQDFEEDVRRSRSILEDLVGERVVGYRAPNFSITDWAIDVLAAMGFRYDSSLFPSMAHDRYGKLKGVTGQTGGVVELRPGFYQVLLSCAPLFGQSVPWAGGGYFRLLPYPVFRLGVRRILRKEGVYCFYIHPWEFDPDQPKVEGIEAWYRFRHYNNLEKTRVRYGKLLQHFTFRPIREAVATFDAT
jgi:polysaccharide deacetylase family protein (PEP-CTERM system associated)